jgi:E3 ubiquitin-protein ligase RFWD2
LFAVGLSPGLVLVEKPNFPFYHTIQQVFVYHKAFPMPVLAYKFNVTDPISGQEIDDQSQFISCVCWRGQSSTLLSANSSGNIKVLQMD